MKIAVISDIHGNIYSLMKVFEDIDENKVDKIICLGDLVGYGPHPNEVIALIKRREIPCLKGNYDASVCDGDFTFIRDNEINSFSLPWTVDELRVSNKYYLESLPTELRLTIGKREILFVHGSPNSINEYLFEDGNNTEEIMSNLNADILVCAHTHIPSCKMFGNKLFINDGSVGKPKIGKPDATYCLLDVNEETGEVKVKVKHIEYEYKRIVKDMTMLKFPNKLIQSYELGKEI
ncbi:MAG: metallophosphoesterase family protein [Clostridium sp.]|uniref:metallophosphoesterase family protein n=1 Tax=Clostridium sp. TaxID=1506 RepID=UPI003EE5A5DF